MAVERQVPTALRVHLAHACVQSIADAVGADLLHIKGPALDGSLRPQATVTGNDGAEVTRALPRLSTDADVLVRPSHVARLMRALDAHGWTIITRFETGSAFEHAASLWHTQLGYVDVHRRFPGITLDPEAAFERLWSRREATRIAHHRCPIPAVPDQRLILLLHAARSGGPAHRDTQLVWTQATPGVRAETLALASEFGAEVALAAATGRLDEFADESSAALWRLHVGGEPPSRLAEWRARILAAPDLKARVRLVARSVLVNTDHLGMALGRPPTRREVASEYGKRAQRIVGEVASLVRRRGPARPR